MTSQEEWRRKSYEEWVGRQGNNSIGSSSNQNGYNEYQREQRKKEENYNAMKNAFSGGGGSCWVATAFYGSANDPRVNALRELRNSLIKQKLLGSFVKELNIIYHKIGHSRFGNWWASELNYKGNYSLIRIATRVPFDIA